ncbi:MAG: response regulator, partial [Bacteroidia bacterium]|nr:response regulator [Bacteroidia bacterium]
EAVEIFQKKEKINLILMDLKMPVLNGYEASKQIRQIDPEVPIIAQTAFAFDESRDNANKAGFTDYISKPFKKEQLLKLIYTHQPAEDI